MNTISKVQVIYSQNNKQILCKETKDCEIKDNVIKVELTQEETLSFNHKMRLEMQVRLLTKDNKTLLSDIIIVSVEKCLSNEVLQ
jgi:predicted metal-binding transcription factor (methanogenesis marker protein 9)